MSAGIGSYKIDIAEAVHYEIVFVIIFTNHLSRNQFRTVEIEILIFVVHRGILYYSHIHTHFVIRHIDKDIRDIVQFKNNPLS